MGVPEVAPLVFPALDEVTGDESREWKEKKKMMAGMRFVRSYWDKRATAEYVSRNFPSSGCRGLDADFATGNA